MSTSLPKQWLEKDALLSISITFLLDIPTVSPVDYRELYRHKTKQKKLPKLPRIFYNS
jgi:hypothetical protein